MPFQPENINSEAVCILKKDDFGKISIMYDAF